MLTGGRVLVFKFVKQTTRAEFNCVQRSRSLIFKCLFLPGDIWVISSSLSFNRDQSVVFKVYSPSLTPSRRVTVRPLSGHVPTTWTNGGTLFKHVTF